MIRVVLIILLLGTSLAEAQEVSIKKERASFRLPDGVELSGELYRPKADGKFPTVLVLHGAGGFDDEIVEKVKNLARQGWVAVAYARRGYPLAGGTAPDRQVARQIMKNSDDVKVVAEQTRGLPFVDASRLGVLGFSEGGLHAYIASYRVPGLKAVIGIGGMPDFVAHYQWVVQNFANFPIPWTKTSAEGIVQAFGCHPKDCPHRYEAVSAYHNVDKVASPVMIIHGRQDLWASFDAASRFAESLKAAGKPYEFHAYDEGHYMYVFTMPDWYYARGPVSDWVRPQFWSKKTAKDAWEKIVAFFMTNLK